MERYRFICVWKIIEGIAPNVGIENHMSTRHGRLCKIPQINLRVTGTISMIRTIREGSFQISGYDYETVKDKLLHNVNKVTSWFEDNHMQINPDKFQYIVFG